MYAKLLYHTLRLFIINSLIVVGKGKGLNSRKLCKKRDTLRKWLEITNIDKAKALKYHIVLKGILARNTLIGFSSMEIMPRSFLLLLNEEKGG